MSPTEYVWVLPRVLLPRQPELLVFHPYVGGAIRTDCGLRLRRYGGYRFLVRLRDEIGAIAKACGRCYRKEPDAETR